jgi:hypothetical protein
MRILCQRRRKRRGKGCFMRRRRSLRGIRLKRIRNSCFLLMRRLRNSMVYYKLREMLEDAEVTQEVQRSPSR